MKGQSCDCYLSYLHLHSCHTSRTLQLETSSPDDENHPSTPNPKPQVVCTAQHLNRPQKGVCAKLRGFIRKNPRRIDSPAFAFTIPSKVAASFAGFFFAPCALTKSSTLYHVPQPCPYPMLHAQPSPTQHLSFALTSYPMVESYLKMAMFCLISFDCPSFSGAKFLISFGCLPYWAILFFSFLSLFFAKRDGPGFFVGDTLR